MRPRRRPGPEPLDPALAFELLEIRPQPGPYPGVSGTPASQFTRDRCDHCKGLHTRKCPAVREIEYYDSGAVKRVVYFAHGEWPEDQVLWLDDLTEAAARYRPDEPEGVYGVA